MSFRYFSFIVVVSCLIALQGSAQDNKPASTDTSFASGSRITAIWLHDNKAKELANLGMLWGFVKYHHPAVAQGNVNMDAALFAVLPKVLAAPNTDSANAIMHRWVDNFDKPQPCTQCKQYEKSNVTKLMPDYGYLFEKDNLPTSLQEKLEYIRLNSGAGMGHYYIQIQPGTGIPIFTNERQYDNPYPDAGLRLLSLYRFWNMIQYYYPHKHLIDADWNQVLVQHIPTFCNATNATEYQLACLKLLTRIQDANATLSGNTQPLNEAMGKYILPFTAQFIEDRLVVTGFYQDPTLAKNNVKPGDIIDQIDGLGILDHIRKYMDITPASNYEAKLNYMVASTGAMLRSNTKEATITIIRDGKPQNIKLNRIEVDTTMQLVDDGIATTKTTQILPGNIGYLNHGSLAKGDLSKVKEMMAGTKGLIIDMRCYSRVYIMSEYKSWLKSTNASYLRYAFMNINHPGVFDIAPAVPSYNDANENSYKGKLIVLVDRRTKGTTEFHTMMLQSIPGAKLVGSTTAGTDGNRSEVPLPGGVFTYFSGHGVLYPDTTETQHKGLRIDKEVRPTIAGILAGKDEVLEAAIKMINE